MNVADSNALSNPSSQDSSAVHSTLQAMDDMAKQLRKTVQDAAINGDSFDSLERSVRETVFQLGHQALELFIQLQGQGDLGSEITTHDNEKLRRSEKTTPTTIRSIFGTHRFEQFTYAPGPKKAIRLRPC